MDALAYKAAVDRTSPTYSFNSAHEEEWMRITNEKDWTRYPISLDGVGYSRLIPPTPELPSLDPVPWWKLHKLFLIKKLARNDHPREDQVK